MIVLILILVGESASGKTTLAKKIEEHKSNNFDFTRIVTYTTRPPREGEVDGVDYHFVSPNVFNYMVNNDKFVEHASYRGWQYGTAINFNKDEDKIIVLTPSGARAFKRYVLKHPELHLHLYVVYLNVNRRARLIKMLQRGDDIEECTRRSLSDVGQFDGFEYEADYVLDNHDYHSSVDQLRFELSLLIESEKHDERHMNQILNDFERVVAQNNKLIK